jgi:hypothetical protein
VGNNTRRFDKCRAIDQNQRLNMTPDPHIFREYDIRGIVRDQLTDDVVEMLAYALGIFLHRNDARRIAIGYDARMSSPRFCEILTRWPQRKRYRRGFDRHGADARALPHSFHAWGRWRCDDHRLAQPARS